METIALHASALLEIIKIIIKDSTNVCRTKAGYKGSLIRSLLLRLPVESCTNTPIKSSNNNDWNQITVFQGCFFNAFRQITKRPYALYCLPT